MKLYIANQEKCDKIGYKKDLKALSYIVIKLM